MKPLLPLLILAVFAQAQTLSELIDSAKANNQSLLASGLTAQSREEEARLGATLDNPMLTLGVNDIQTADIHARDLEPMQTQSVALSQKIPISGRLGYAERKGEHTAAASRLSSDGTRVRIVYGIKQAVYRTAKLKEELGIIRRYRKLLGELGEIHTLYNLESKSHYQMALKTEILKNTLGVRESRAQNAIAVQKARLSELTGVEVGDVEHTLSLPFLPSLSAIKEQVAANPDLRGALETLEASREEVGEMRAAEIPDITVGLGYFQREAFEDYYAVTLTIPLTLYDRENLAVAGSQKRRDAMVQTVESLKRKLGFDMEEAYYGLKQAREEYKLFENIRVSRREITDSLIGRIESKQSALMEGYEVIGDTFESELKLLETMLEANLYQARIEMLKGAEQ